MQVSSTVPTDVQALSPELVAQLVHLVGVRPADTVLTASTGFLDSPAKPVYDVVMLGASTGLEHVTHALACVHAAGVVVAVMPGDLEQRQDLEAVVFRDFVADAGGWIEPLGGQVAVVIPSTADDLAIQLANLS